MNIPDEILPLTRLRKVLIGKDFYLRRDIKIPVRTIGQAHANWTFDPESLHRDSVVYCFGVGRDISFDLGLIEAFHLKVHAFDPTPDSKAWIEGQALPEGFRFFPVGVADYDGDAAFFAPPPEGPIRCWTRSTIRSRSTWR